MTNWRFASNFLAEGKVAATSIFLIANAFVWYFYSFTLLVEMIEIGRLTSFETLFIYVANFVGIFFSGLIGVFFVDRLGKRKKLLLIWSVTGAFLSPLFLLLNLSTFTGLLVLSSVFGLYFGLGMPAAMGYFASSTNVSSRARMGGLTFLFIGISFSVLGSVGIADITINALILAILRGSCLVLLSNLKSDETPIATNNKISYKFIISDRSFILYFLPWLIFSLVNYLAIPIMNTAQGEDFVRFSMILENVLIAVFAVVSGFLADRFGRKRFAILGFVILGLGYAVLGLFNQSVFSWYFYIALDGVAWGIFFTLFIFTIWGDLAANRASDKIYLVGVLPYLFINLLRFVIGSYISTMVEYTMVFSFTAFFLFLAVFPIAYAPETLPEKVLKDRDLKSYVGKAIEKVQKETGKHLKNNLGKIQANENENPISEVEIRSEDEEARRLAEKYY